MTQKHYSLSCDVSDPFAPILQQLVQQEFPTPASYTPGALLDHITREVFASKLVRLGPLPAPEAQVLIRAQIKQAIEFHEPVRFIAPWGSEKPDGSGIDLAELGALRTLKCLNDRVSAHYAPGVEVNLRVEDASAGYLLSHPSANEVAAKYSADLASLVRVLDLPHVRVVSELSSVSTREFDRAASEVLEDMYPWLLSHLDKDGQWTVPPPSVHSRNLQLRGWFKPELGFPAEAKSFYFGQYAKLYPEATRPQWLSILARYLASALARKSLGLDGTHGNFTPADYIGLSFMAPIPGISAIHDKRVFYRTLPTSVTSQHIPPWRAKGYALVDGESRGSVIKLAPFSALPDDLNSYSVQFTNGMGTVQLQTDYVVRS